MDEDKEFHFEGIESVEASGDGKRLLFKTHDGAGKGYYMALNADEASGAIFKILAASADAELKETPEKLKTMGAEEIALFTSDSANDRMGIRVRFRSGTAPFGIQLTKTPLIRLAIDILQRLAPEKLAKAAPSEGKRPE